MGVIKPLEVYKQSLYPMMAKLELCRRHPEDFFNFITGFKANKHQLEIMEKLKNLPDNGRIIISCPPRHGKSQVVSKLFPAWLMGKAHAEKKRMKIGVFSYGQKLSNDASIDTRGYIQSQYYKYVFPDISLTSENVEKWRIESEKEISYMASSVGGVATGLGFDWIIIDDPIKNWEEARNREQTEKIYNWYQSVALTRAEKGCKIVIIATRWSDHDLTGRLISSGDYEYYNYPAIDEYGNALWEDQFDLETLEGIRRQSNPKIWSCVYQGNPIPDEGQIIKPEDILYGSPSRPACHSIISWDTASKIGEPNDWSVGVEMEKDDTGNIYITNMIRVKEEFPDLVQTIKTWGTSPNIYIEDKASGIQLIQQLKRECKRNIIPVSVSKNKVYRLESVSPVFRVGKVYFNDEYKYSTMIKELLEFPDGANDDCVDAISQGLTELTVSNRATSGVNKESLLKKSAYANLF